MNVQQELRLVAGLGSLSTTWSTEHEVFRTSNTLETAQDVLLKRGKVYNDFEAYRDPETLLRAITSVPGSLHPQTSVGEIQAGNRASLDTRPRPPSDLACGRPIEGTCILRCSPGHSSDDGWR